MGILYLESNLTSDPSIKVKQVGQRSNYHKMPHNSLHVSNRELECTKGDRKVCVSILFLESNLTCDLSFRFKGQIIKEKHNYLNSADRELECIGFRYESGYGHPISKVLQGQTGKSMVKLSNRAPLLLKYKTSIGTNLLLKNMRDFLLYP